MIFRKGSRVRLVVEVGAYPVNTPFIVNNSSSALIYASPVGDPTKDVALNPLTVRRDHNEAWFREGDVIRAVDSESNEGIVIGDEYIVDSRDDPDNDDFRVLANAKNGDRVAGPRVLFELVEPAAESEVGRLKQQLIKLHRLVDEASDLALQLADEIEELE